MLKSLKMNYSLIIDTSSEYSMIGLSYGNQLTHSLVALHANQLSCSLLPAIVALTQQAEISLRHLSYIAVGVGPGSYTGTRVGVAVAKALSFGLNIPLRTFCSLLTLLTPFCGSFACIMPSNTENVFLLKGHQSSTHLDISCSSLLPPSALERELHHPIDHLFQKSPERSPSLIAPVLYLTSSQHTPVNQEARLIYLHQP